MSGNRTLTMIKPDAVDNGYIGPILEKITGAGFKIIAMKYTQLSRRDAEAFYAIHRQRPFFGELVSFMTRGPIVAAILEKENAVEDFRALIGATNPAEAAEGTIRKLYAKDIGENAIHGSDSDENAAIEGAFHFSGREIYS
ncbi:MAG: nucleoside-diphosphate kinase [Bacteroidetes bacterium]|jgi:nucleoside-diphosphate kinase|nr:MAG: nucleoside-diphosphate kinase [Bacteroidota bacterium]UCE68166.1 MAG: nucleoside-diphosphate kinase [Flavobacteriaceae bacterium]